MLYGVLSPNITIIPQYANKVAHLMWPISDVFISFWILPSCFYWDLPLELNPLKVVHYMQPDSLHLHGAL